MEWSTHLFGPPDISFHGFSMIQPSKSVSSRCLIDWFNQFAFIPESSREIRGNLAKSVSIFSFKINTTLLIFHFDLLVYQTQDPTQLIVTSRQAHSRHQSRLAPFSSPSLHPARSRPSKTFVWIPHCFASPGPPRSSTETPFGSPREDFETERHTLESSEAPRYSFRNRVLTTPHFQVFIKTSDRHISIDPV